MATDASNQRELQEKSIKARKRELFVGESEEQTGPRKSFRQVLSETPAAPLSKNVKIILWGSAAPVALLFIAALLVPSKSAAKAKAPELLLPINQSLVKPKEIAKQSSDQSPTPADVKPEGGAKPETPAEEKKEPAKPKKKTTTKKKTPAKPKEEPALAKSDEGSNPDDATKSASGGSKSKSEKADGKSASASAKPPPPDPSKRTVSIFKKRKPPVFTYPKRGSEKKDEGTDGQQPSPDSPDAGLP
jgi:hypothetical protein